MAFPDYFTEPQQPLGTVYVVDDDEAVCDSVRWLLEAGNYKVEIFDSGESFIAKYDPQAIAVLLLDVRMSGMSGLEVQEHLIARKADLPIIILTAYGDVQMAVNALKKGAVDFIEKPFDHAALRQLVEKCSVKHAADAVSTSGKPRGARNLPNSRRANVRFWSASLPGALTSRLPMTSVSPLRRWKPTAPPLWIKQPPAPLPI